MNPRGEKWMHRQLLRSIPFLWIGFEESANQVEERNWERSRKKMPLDESMPNAE